MALTDFETSIKTYLENILKEDFPELTSEAGSQISDLTVNPMIETMKPILDLINRIDFVHNLANAENMTAAELDEIGLNNYGMERGAGEKASGNVYVEMNPEYVGPTQVVIGAITAQTTAGLTFNGINSTVIRYSTNEEVAIPGTILPGIAADYLNVGTGKYEFPVYVEAEAEGTDYNVAAGSITTLVTQYPLLTGTISNKEAFSNGTAKETNIDYANRLRQSWSSRHLGSVNSYRNYVLSEFVGAEDVLVQGYLDTLMKRDMFLMKENGNFIFRHMGGKVDLYVKGEDYQQYQQSVYIKSDLIRLTYPNLVSDSFIDILNLTDASNTGLAFELTYQYPETRTGYVDLKVKAGTGSAPSTDDLIEIKYKSYTDDTRTSTIWFTDYMYYKSKTSRLVGVPYSSIVSITEDLLGTLGSQAGATSTQIILPSGFSAEDDFYNNLVIDVTLADGTVASKTITDYTGSTKVGTVSAWATQPASGNTFVIKGLEISEDSSDGYYSIAYETPIIETATAPDQTGMTNVQFKLDADVRVPIEDFYKDNTLEIIDGTGSGQSKNIEACNTTTGVCTIDVAWSTQPDATSVYRVITNEGAMSDTLKLSTREKVNFTIDDTKTLGSSTPAFMTDSILNITYVYDKLMGDIQNDLDVEGHRIIATDVLVRKAKPMYTYITMKLMPKRGYSIGSDEKLTLQGIIEDILGDVDFNTSLYASDIVGTLYKNVDVMEFLQYIQLPIGMQSYETSQSLTEAQWITKLEGDATYQNSSISYTNDQYPVLGALIIDDLSQ